MKNFLSLLSLLCLVLLPVGCQTLSPGGHAPEGFDPSNWLVVAKAAVRVDGERSSDGQALAQSFAMEWQQTHDDFRIFLRGALGIGATTIVSENRQVEVRKGNEVIARSDDADALSRQALGIEIPIAALRFWMLGLSADSTAGDATSVDAACDAANHCALETINENDWVIQFPEVMRVGSVVLPKKIQANAPGIQLKLLVRDWSSGSALALQD